MPDGLLRDRALRGIAVLLLALIAATSYWYSLAIRKPRSAPPPAPGTPDFVVERLALTQFDGDGRARYRLFATELTHFNENDDIVLASPRLVTLYPDRPQVEARARRARLENSGERVLMTGSVLLTRAAGPDAPPLALSTEAMTAWPDDDVFESDVRTELARGSGDQRFTTVAERMRYDNVRRLIVFGGGVRTEFPARGR